MCPTNHLLLLAVGSLKGRHPDSQLTITPGASLEPPVHPTYKSVDCRRSQRERTNTRRKWNFIHKQGIRTWNLFAVGVPVILFWLFKSQVVCWASVAMVTVNVGWMPHCVCWLNPHSWSRPLRFWRKEWKRSWIQRRAQKHPPQQNFFSVWYFETPQTFLHSLSPFHRVSALLQQHLVAQRLTASVSSLS